MSSSTNEPGGGDRHDDGAVPPYPHSNPYAGQGEAGQGYQGQPQQGQPVPPPGGNQYQQYPPSYGQQQPGYYPPSYGQPVYMMPPAAPKNLSITSLVLGVASMLGFAFFLVPQVLAVIFGHLGLKREPEGRGMAIGGLVMGYICIAGWIAVVILYAALIGMALNTSEISGTYNS